MKLHDFRTVHRSNSAYTITIEYSGVGSSGKYTSPLTKEFTFQLDEIQQELVDGWVKTYAPEAKTYSWKLEKIELAD